MTDTRTSPANRVTLADIAQEASVSLSTISKVLNGRSDVSAPTRARIEALLSEHGYLRRKTGETTTGLVELVFHELEAAWSMEIIRGVENIAAESGGGGERLVGGILELLVLVFSNQQCGHPRTPASFFSFDTRSATSFTFTPALRPGGSVVLTISWRGVRSTP